jgi:hypothetical protein
MAVFAEDNFKQCVVLSFYKRDKQMQWDIEDVMKRNKIRDDFSGNLHPALSEYLTNYELSDERLAGVRHFNMPGIGLIQKLIPGYSGEANPWAIRSYIDVKLLPALEVFEWGEDKADIDPKPLLSHPSIKKVVLGTEMNNKHEKQFENHRFKIIEKQEYGTITWERP